MGIMVTKVIIGMLLVDSTILLEIVFVLKSLLHF